mmetsp:Transcript_41999/g.100997  ORF Transcript_41999/g.100997 Transcript_41999/m.100997 type:complete len:304 (+) Transcript_41999:859-1770(+)
MHTHSRAQQSRSGQQPASSPVVTVHELHDHSSLRKAHASVQVVLACEVHRGGGHAAIKLGEGNQGPGEGDPTNRCSQDCCQSVPSSCIRMDQEGCNGCECCSSAYQRVEGRHGLRQRHRLHGLANGVSPSASSTDQCHGNRHTGPRHSGQCGGHSPGHTNSTQEAPKLGSALGSQPTDGSNAHQTGSGVGAGQCGRRDPRGQGRQTQRGEVVGPEILLTWLAEQVQHPFRDQEPSHNVHRGNANGKHGQQLCEGSPALSEEQQPSNCGEPTDRVCDRHERGMKRVAHTVDHLVTGSTRQPKCL